MKERLLEFLRTENKSSAQLAEEIGVQPSGISHILSGRNNPSLDFVLKMLEKYPFLSTDWLLFGKGTMYKDKQMQSLFDDADPADSKPGTGSVPDEPFRQIPESNLIEKDPARNEWSVMLKRKRNLPYQELLCSMMIAVLKNIFREVEFNVTDTLKIKLL